MQRKWHIQFFRSQNRSMIIVPQSIALLLESTDYTIWCTVTKLNEMPYHVAC